MTKVFYVFLLNLFLLNERHQFEAVLLKPKTLHKLHFDIENSDLKEFENLPSYLRTFSEPEETIEKSRNKVKRLENSPLELFPPKYSNFINDGVENNMVPLELSQLHYGPLDVFTINSAMKKVNFRKLERKKRVPEKYSDQAVRFLDYTNSQMPFNEGRISHKSAKEKLSEAGGKKKASGENSGTSLRRRRFEAPLRSRNVETPRDDPLLEYSRVRRFLDHKRAKKQIRMSSTLEAKEAAMSRILDPNLDSDGILEPHVRKRRGLHTRKRDLNSYKRNRKRRKSQRYKPPHRF